MSKDDSENDTDKNCTQNVEEDLSEFEFGTDFIDDPDDENVHLRVPRCPTTKKPFVGQIFGSLESGEEFFKKYASIVGFVVKKSTGHTFKRSDVISDKYYRCNRDGYKNVGQGTGKRNTNSDRVGCNARLILKYGVQGTYVVSTFVEEHTHNMVPNYARHLMKSNRKMELGHKKFMMSCAKANLGPVRSHKLLKEIVGGYLNMRATTRDFKNYKRNLITNIKEADAQILINKFIMKKEMNSAFYFDYTVNESQQLTKLFWSDPLAIRNYAAFGQVVSFDSTYGTNRYNVVFAPFTGLDNHKRCVTFRCGLLMKGDVESFTWLFEQFKHAMKSEPTIIVTDQDPAMKVAVENVFKNTRQRFCMWHIMEKVSKKVTVAKLNEPGYRKTFGHVVWSDEISTQQFEDGWSDFLDKYDERGNPWFKDMYDLRMYWIPSYFRDIVLGGLVRTTSISESQNSFFGKYSNKGFSLVELFTHFENALEKQRYNQQHNDMDSATKSRDLKTPVLMENHASEIYTLNMFAQVQEAISDACFYCSVINQTKGDWVVDFTTKEGMDEYEVQYMITDGFTTCTCMMYNRTGISCSHTFTAWKTHGCKKIPDTMILKRWTKDASRDIHSDAMSDVLTQSARIENNQSKLSSVWSAIHACIGLADGNEDRLDVLLSNLNKIRYDFEQDDVQTGKTRSIRAEAEEFAGIPIPEEIHVRSPAVAKNKGSGTAKRLRGGKEIVMEEQQKASKKGKRKCKKCGMSTGHDSRNCDKFNNA